MSYLQETATTNPMIIPHSLNAETSYFSTLPYTRHTSPYQVHFTVPGTLPGTSQVHLLVPATLGPQSSAPASRASWIPSGPRPDAGTLIRMSLRLRTCFMILSRVSKSLKTTALQACMYCSTWWKATTLCFSLISEEGGAEDML